jgi:predicted porin
MRKLLLASAAGVGALTLAATDASAQYSRFTAPQSAGPVIQNEPGLAVRLAGRYRFFVANSQADFNNFSNAAGASVKGGNFDFYDYARVWPGFDGMAANGLRYGAQLEIRMRTNADARGDTRSQLFYRRIFGYVATPTLGQLRMGTSGGAIELMHVGHLTGAIASGGWDGDFPTAITGPANPSLFWYSSSGANNSTKLTYLSPQFFGFDAGISYAPTDGNFESGGCAVGQFSAANGGVNCDRLLETNLDGGAQRTRHMYELMLRFRGSFGPVGLAVSGGYLGSDTVGASGNALAFDGLSVGLLGAQATFAGLTVGGIITGGKGNYATNTRTNQALGVGVNAPGAFSVNAATGAISQAAAAPNNTVAYGNGTPLRPLPSDGNNDGLFTWQIGARYAIGPFSVGAAYHEARYEGSIAAAADAKDRGFNIGGAYAVAPGLNLFLEYLYGRREENGVNLRTGQTGTINNKATSNTIGLGVAFNW